MTILTVEEQMALPITGTVEGVPFSILRGETQQVETPRGLVELVAGARGVRATVIRDEENFWTHNPT